MRQENNPQRERYFFASGFQFCSSVIGAAALSSSVLMRKRPLGATSVLSGLCRVLAAADDARGKEDQRRARCERGPGDGDRRRHHRARWVEVIEFLAVGPPPRIDAARRGHLPLPGARGVFALAVRWRRVCGGVSARRCRSTSARSRVEVVSARRGHLPLPSSRCRGRARRGGRDKGPDVESRSAPIRSTRRPPTARPAKTRHTPRGTGSSGTPTAYDRPPSARPRGRGSSAGRCCDTAESGRPPTSSRGS